jgi:prepilin peptidase CpaA
MQLPELIPICFLLAVLFVATVHDIRYQKIPNLLTLTSISVSLIYYSCVQGISGFVFSLAGIGVGMAVMLPPYIMGGMGAGDAKLMAAVGGVLGPKGVFIAFLFTGLAGGFYSVILLMNSGNLAVSLRRYWLIVKTFLVSRRFTYFPPSEEVKKLRMRYGISISLGTLFSIVLRNTINNHFI